MSVVVCLLSAVVCLLSAVVCLLPAIAMVLYLQELLELQYEGVAVMLLFDRAKVNVNLLIHLLNKKFYVTK